jgi:hypothetical protein
MLIMYVPHYSKIYCNSIQIGIFVMNDIFNEKFAIPSVHSWKEEKPYNLQGDKQFARKPESLPKTRWKVTLRQKAILTILHVHVVQHGWTISCHLCQTSIDLQILEFHRPQSMKRAIIMKLHYGTTLQFKPAVHGNRKTGNTLHSYHHLLQYLPFTELWYARVSYL